MRNNRTTQFNLQFLIFFKLQMLIEN